jgi:ATP-dependent Clp protease ATP-binding subunit ClpA
VRPGVTDRIDRFTPRAQRVLKLAEDEAERFRHAEIGTEHLLLGLLREGRGLGALALRDLGASSDEIRRRLEPKLTPGDVAAEGSLGLSPSVRHSIEMAVAEANRFHHTYVGTEHLLLGLLRGGEGEAYRTLENLGVSLDRARRQVVRLINEAPDPERANRAGVFGMVRGMRGPREESVFGAEQCARCERAGRPEWRFCAFCGEPRPRCERCGEPIPRLAAVMFCPHCGGVVGDNEPA